MSEHELKCWPEFFSAILTGEKTFELRKDDIQPPFRAGDVLWLREWRRGDKEYTGRDLRLTVTYILSGFGLAKDYVVMGFQSPAMTPPPPAPATDYGELVTRLREAARECEREGVNGWGNCMTFAADAIEALEKDKAWRVEMGNRIGKEHEALKARADQLAAEVAGFQRDTEWRHRWHGRLGRGGTETEGKFYERLEAVIGDTRRDE